jgi:hypothetical protein
VQEHTQAISCEITKLNGKLNWFHTFVYGAKGHFSCEMFFVCSAEDALKEGGTCFFKYSFCNRIWKECLSRCIIDHPPVWEDIIERRCKRVER